MSLNRSLCLQSALATALLAMAGSTAAQTVLPPPTVPFAGKIGETYADSVPSFQARTKAPAGAPNVVLILTDDVGFGAASTFGGPIPTPNLDRLAARGLVYNRFHTTAMCSPTRAALLTGRNHHAVGNGIVANLSTGFPGYDNLLPKSAATLAEVLRQNGYNTAMFGKHHNAPEADVSPAGPFDLWPTGLGFEYFYGFMASQTNQFTPTLYRGTARAPEIAAGVLDKALADDAIRWLHDQQAAAPDKPFFLYYATGSNHAPVQAPADWIAKFRGRFDRGWDVVRAETHARQLQSGVIPRGTVNTPRPEGIKPWNELTPDERRINARMMEVYAAMLAYQDDQIGRVLAELDRMGESQNTLVMFIEGDNGAAAEAGPNGGSNPMAAFANGMKEDTATQAAHLDEMGGPNSIANYGYGWAWATNAPFKLFKQYASHLGGTRNGLVVSWPDRIASRGLRTQFAHVTDVVPTVLDVAGIAAPARVNGVDQQPIDGTSLAYTFTAGDAPERHRQQYFEMMGNRAVYADGWLANTVPANAPWMRSDGRSLPTTYGWELYDLRSDFSQAKDVAAQNPQKLAELQALFRSEGERNHVFPLDDRLTMARFGAAQAQHPARSLYTYWGAGVSLPVVNAAPLVARSFRIAAKVVLPAAAEGAVLALGSKFGGWAFYLKEGRPVALLAASQLPGDQFRVASADSLAPGAVELVFDFVYDGGVNGGGEMVISADGREMARGRMPRTVSKFPEMTDTLDIGFDADTPVTDDYALGGKFNGTIVRVDVEPGKPGKPGPVRANGS